MEKNPSLLDRFIEKFLLSRISPALSDYVEGHFDELDLGYGASVCKEPESATFISAGLLFTRNIKVIGYRVTFDAVFDCEIETEQIIRREPEQESVNEWVRVSCKMNITDRLESFEVKSICGYQSERKSNGADFATEDFIPVISREQLESEALDFLIAYCVEVLEKPMPVPIEDIIQNKMNLGIVRDFQLTPNLSIFGMLCYAKGEVPVYVGLHEETSVAIDGPTVFVDPYVSFLRNIGCENNTLAHEAVHWHKHRIYAMIKGLLDGEQHIANRCDAEPDEKVLQNSFQTPDEWMEWQANWLAPRILMPLMTVKTKARELIAKYGYDPMDKGDRLDAMKAVIDELADFYRVSKQAARIRMIEIGYDDARHIYNYKERVPEIKYTITPTEALDEYMCNDEFREIVDSGMFAYAEGSFVIDHESLIDRSGAFPMLTNRAKSNLPMYALRFAEREAFYYFYYGKLFDRNDDGAFYRKSTDLKNVNRYSKSYNDETIERGEELTKIAERINEQYDVDADDSLIFCRRVWTNICELGWDYNDFVEETQLNQKIYYDIKGEKLLNPKIETVMAICIGLKLKWRQAEHYLSLCGYTLRNTRTENAYRHVFMYSEYGMDYCNSILSEMGVPLLGSQL
jgi:hypothetical protein